MEYDNFLIFFDGTKKYPKFKRSLLSLAKKELSAKKIITNWQKKEKHRKEVGIADNKDYPKEA